MKSLKTLTALIALTGSLAFATPKITFQDSQTRYLSGHDLFRLFAQHFPLTAESTGAILRGKEVKDPLALISPDCIRFGDTNRGALGDSNPATGEPIYRTASSAYVRWYTGCLRAAISTELYLAGKQPGQLVRFYGEALKGGDRKINETLVTAPDSILWNKISEPMKKGILLHLLHLYIGPGILNDEGAFVKSAASALDENLSVEAALKKAIFYIAMREEFLTY
jgi:hypothetical protein